MTSELATYLNLGTCVINALCCVFWITRIRKYNAMIDELILEKEKQRDWFIKEIHQQDIRNAKTDKALQILEGLNK